MQIKLTKIPSVFRPSSAIAFPSEVEIDPNIDCREGAVIVARALTEHNVTNMLELQTGRIATLVEGDIIPGVLGKRRASREFSGDIPTSLQVGDKVHLLSESGVFGELVSYNPAWGEAMQLEVLGSVVHAGKPLNLRAAGISWQNNLPKSVPLIAVLATAMSSGKTTSSCQIAKHFTAKGFNVAYGKLTGVAYQGDPYKVADFGAKTVMNFVDGGLPSTCGEPESVSQMALGVLTALNQTNPDFIIVEFGASILGEYNVSHLLKEADIKQHIQATVLAANDKISAWGAQRLLQELDIPISLITGPVVNNGTEADFIEQSLGIPAESNLNADMPKLMAILEQVLGSA